MSIRQFNFGKVELTVLLHTATEKVIRPSLGSHIRNDHKEIRMLPYVYHALHTFRKVFTRHSTWLTFCVVVLGFLGATQIDGVSSLCRF